MDMHGAQRCYYKMSKKIIHMFYRFSKGLQASFEVVLKPRNLKSDNAKFQYITEI